MRVEKKLIRESGKSTFTKALLTNKTGKNKYEHKMRRNLPSAEEKYATRNIRKEEVYIEAKINTHNAGRGMKHELYGAA